jgi:hypothetical protein
MYMTKGFYINVNLWVTLGMCGFSFPLTSFVILHYKCVVFVVRKVTREPVKMPTVLLCLFPPLLSRLSQNLDGVVIEFLFRQSKISEVLGGSGYNSDRLCLPYIPQLTGMSLPLSFPDQLRA